MARVSTATDESRKQRKREYYLKNRESIKAKTRARYLANRDKCIERSRAWREKNKDRIIVLRQKWYARKRAMVIERGSWWARMNPERRKAIALKSHLKSRFGITTDVYEKLVRAQHGRCGICRNIPTKGRLSVDHDHVTGIVRGLLCVSCNAGVGQFRDDPKLLSKAIAWLKKAGR